MTTAPEPLDTHRSAGRRATLRATCAGSPPSGGSSSTGTTSSAWSVADLDGFELCCGVLRRPRGRRLRACRPARARPRRVVPGCEAELRGARLPRQPTTASRCARPSPVAGGADLGELDGIAGRRRPAGARRRARRPRRGLPPDVPEAVAFACASIGATWSSRSRLRRAQRDRPARPDRAEGAARRRRLLRGRDFDRLGVVAEIREAIPSLEHTVLLPYRPSRRPPASLLGRAGAAARAGLDFSSCRSTIRGGCLPSGTTGLPKGLVHGQGGLSST
jgi:hypothetical protein